MPRVSLIMPVYNVESYLDEALASIQQQTMADFEVIIVDDGSTDLSASIAERFCQADARFRYLRQDNRGPGPGGGRNGGLGSASSDLLMFMDSDDVVRPDMFEQLVGLLADEAVDMATTSAERLSGVTLRRSSIHDISHPKFEPSTTAEQSPWLMFDSTPWNKMFRRSFFDEVVGSWPEQQLYEDIAPMTRCQLAANRVGVLTSPHYLWRNRGDGSSITQQRSGVEADLAQIEQLVAADRLTRELGSQTTKAWLDWKAYTFDFVWMIRKMATLRSPHMQELATAMAAAMDSIGTSIVSALGPQLRECTDAIIARDMQRVRRLSLRHRLALVPDRRGYDQARQTSFLNASLLSITSRGAQQEVKTASRHSASSPQLILSSTPPWADPGDQVAIAPAQTRRRGESVRSTFVINPQDLPSQNDDQPTFVNLRGDNAQSELRRSIEDRLRRRLPAGDQSSPIRSFFEDGMLVLLGPASAPLLETVELHGEEVLFGGQLPSEEPVAANSDIDRVFARVTDLGTIDHRFELERSGTSFTIRVPLEHLVQGADFFLAIADRANPGIPLPISVAHDLTSGPRTKPHVRVQASTNGQASFRFNGNPVASTAAEILQRKPWR